MITAVQRERRKHGVGGSDIPIVVGAVKYKTREQLLYEKAGLVEPEQPPEEKVYWGNALEGPIRERLTALYAWEIEADLDTLYHPQHAFLMCHLDGLVAAHGEPDFYPGPGVLEIKNSQYQPKKTGAPEHQMLQLLWNIGIAQCRWGCLAVLVGGCELRTTIVPHDPIVFNGLVAHAVAFWRDVLALQAQHTQEVSYV